MGYWIKRFNMLAGGSSSLDGAFEKWKYQKKEQCEILKKTKFAELSKRNKENDLYKESTAMEMQQKHELINETKEQRTFLIGKVIAG